MKCNEVNSKLIFYLENDLPKHEMKQVELHLSGCQSCAESLSFIQLAMEEIEKEKSLEQNPYFVSKTVNRWKEGQFESAVPMFAKLVKPALLSVLFVLAISSGIFMGANFARSDEPLQHSDLVDPYFNEMEGETIEMFFLNEMDHE